MKEDNVWAKAAACAERIAPADAWRRTLASEVRAATHSVFAAVCTCPPGMYVEPLAATDPPAFGRIIEQIVDEFLPRVERAGDGAALVARVGPEAYAPLDQARDQSLAQRFRTEILEPLGVKGMINAFFLGASGEIMGWIAVGTREPSNEAVDRYGAELTYLAGLAANTLRSALELAAGLGVVPLAEQAHDLVKLTAREREVAQLVASGLSDANVAARLGVSEQTVGTHLRRVYNKVKVHSRAELVSRVGGMLTRTRG